MDKAPIITFDDFSFRYTSQAEPTLKNISLSIYPGEKVLILGPSGSGKSTFAHAINGLIPHAYPGEISGSVVVDGKQVESSSIFELSYSTGTVLQDTDHQFVGLSVAEDLAFSMENGQVALPEMQSRVHKWAEKVHVQDHLTASPYHLSGGQKQRVSMGGVLIDEGSILLFDEPLANLDPRSGQESIELIDDLHRQTKATVLIIEHRLEDVLVAPVDRVLVFSEGRVIADSKPEELLRDGLLPDLGIRQPLYISAMEYAGVDLESVEHLDSLKKVSGPYLKEQMQAWQSTLPQVRQGHFIEPLLEIEDLNFSYSKTGKQILKDITLTLHKGEMISIVGQNGAGKSTLSKVICGFEKETSGHLIWEGQDFSKLSIKERADHIGYVMQNPNEMITQHLIFDEIALGLRYRGVPEQEIEERVHAILKICGLYPFRTWPIKALSYGQKKRVTIASILVLNPQIIILDEPTAGQDFAHYREMMEFLKRINESGITVVMITHDMHLMLEYTNRTLVMTDGKIIADTNPVKVLTNLSLIEQASLKVTSLFEFAQRLGLSDPVEFTEKFIAFDREVNRS